MYAYRLQIQTLARILNEQVPELLPAVHIVPHALAFNDLRHYVDTVARLAGLPVSERARDKAIANIDPSLYRYRLPDFSPEILEWNEKKYDARYLINLNGFGVIHFPAIFTIKVKSDDSHQCNEHCKK